MIQVNVQVNKDHISGHIASGRTHEYFYKEEESKVMKRLLLHFGPAIFSVFLLLSCEKPAEEHSTVQQRIDWPSLAAGYHGGPLQNGLFFEKEPSKGEILWKRNLVNRGMGGTAPVLDEDHNVYVNTQQGDFQKFSSSGDSLWTRHLDDEQNIERPTSPMILANGNIVHLNNRNFVIMNSDGDILIDRDLPARVICESFSIDRAGNFYALYYDSGVLFSLDAEGNLRWEVDPSGDYNDSFTSLTEPILMCPDEDAMVVAGGKNLYKVSTEGTVLWSRPAGIYTRIIENDDGDVFYWDRTDTTLYSINTDGRENWRIKTSGVFFLPFALPTVLINGNIVFAVEGTRLKCFSPQDGHLVWTTGRLDGFLYSELVSDMDGNIYFVMSMASPATLYAYNLNGQQIWSLEDGSIYVESSPTIANGKLYFNNSDRMELYVVE